MYYHPTVQRPAVAEKSNSRSEAHVSTAEAPEQPLLRVRKILVPFDDSERSLEALRHLVRTVDTTAMEVHLVNVQRLVMPSDFVPDVPVLMEVRSRLATGEQVMKSARGLLDRRGVSYKTKVLFGDPAKAIARYAAEQGVDAIVMGTRGLNTIAGIPRRSMAAKVLRLTDVPITVVKAAGARLTETPTGG